ncbi:hypothetical protein [Actinokineospora diospyrosa]|uniref:Lipoprotein n=1 Tax=Actinokineospora diospyrosa TaxID=103728 RepID=A0ABT1I9X9_9PSEU|nr:hypothetical protein [Actinokineospora diospyrosa]MCP2269346.1 hypothetical protein [Actinokineospora diospyrosa]
MRGLGGRFLLLAAIALTLFASTACGASALEVKEDAAVDREFQRISRDRTSAPLSGIVASRWDSVHVFATEAADRDEVEAAVGRDVDMPDTFFQDGTLMVFMSGEEAVTAVVVWGFVLDPGHYGRTATVRKTADDYRLRIVEGK